MNQKSNNSISYYKMHGSGNDFVLVDNREAHLSADQIAGLAEPVCKRKFGVGADGLIVLDVTSKGSGADYIWHFYNSDGSAAEMCGNGSRCAARLAFELGLAGRDHVLGTTAGPIRAHVLDGSSEVKVQMTDPIGLALDTPLQVNGSELTVHFVNTGVPHAVVFGNNVKSVDVNVLGRAIRTHEHFAPAGANVNFAQVKDKQHILLRTYERGVEDETFACGTGACAAAYVAHALGLTDPEVAITTSGGEILHISIQEGTVFLQGKTAKVASGRFYPEAL